MKRQEFLLNLTLVVIIGALAYAIYEASRKPTGLDGLDVAPAKTVTAKDTETSYESSATEARYTELGKKPIFQALLSPTPSPTPTPPPPAPTPDIGKALAQWKLLSVYEGVAIIEDIQKAAKGEEGATFEMRLNDTKQVDVGSGIMKTATLVKMDETDPYDPSVTFKLEGTTAERTIKMSDEPSAAAPAIPPPGSAAPAPK